MSALLSDQVRLVTWFSKGTGSSYFKEQTQHFTDVEGVKRTTATLDSIVDRYGQGARFQYIKIDAQGAEIDILKGGNKTLSSAEYIQLELPFGGEYNRNAPTFADYIKYMDGIGFTPVAECEQHQLRSPSSHGNWLVFQIDFIFAKKNNAYIKVLQQVIHDQGGL